MRLIKFRAWDVRLKRMYYPDSFYAHHGELSAALLPYQDAHVNLREDNCILMQFTGLLDRQGKEIYEGDIVAWNREDLVDAGERIVQSSGKGVIAWNNELARYGFTQPNRIGMFGMDDQLEILGNIYENPDLLTGRGEVTVEPGR